MEAILNFYDMNYVKSFLVVKTSSCSTLQCIEAKVIAQWYEVWRLSFMCPTQGQTWFDSKNSIWPFDPAKRDF